MPVLEAKQKTDSGGRPSVSHWLREPLRARKKADNTHPLQSNDPRRAFPQLEQSSEASMAQLLTRARAHTWISFPLSLKLDYTSGLTRMEPERLLQTSLEVFQLHSVGICQWQLSRARPDRVVYLLHNASVDGRRANDVAEHGAHSDSCCVGACVGRVVSKREQSDECRTTHPLREYCPPTPTLHEQCTVDHRHALRQRALTCVSERASAIDEEAAHNHQQYLARHRRPTECHSEFLHPLNADASR